jgi:hypothetical protein
MKSAITLLAATLSLALVSAPARAQHTAPHQVTAVGTYDLQVEHSGQAMSAVLTLWEEKDGRLTGTITLHGEAMPLDSVTVEGHDLNIRAALPHGALTMSFTFKNKDELTGTFTMEGMGNGTAAGTRRKN